MNYFFTTHWQWICFKSTDDLPFDLKSAAPFLLLLLFLFLQRLCRKMTMNRFFAFDRLSNHWILLMIDTSVSNLSLNGPIYLCHRQNDIFTWTSFRTDAQTMIFYSSVLLTLTLFVIDAQQNLTMFQDQWYTWLTNWIEWWPWNQNRTRMWNDGFD